jgi:hypothetical protein
MPDQMGPDDTLDQVERQIQRQANIHALRAKLRHLGDLGASQEGVTADDVREALQIASEYLRRVELQTPISL